MSLSNKILTLAMAKNIENNYMIAMTEIPMKNRSKKFFKRTIDRE